MPDFSYCKLEIFVPASHFSAVQTALAESDAGHIGPMTNACPIPPSPASGGRWPGRTPISARRIPSARQKNSKWK